MFSLSKSTYVFKMKLGSLNSIGRKQALDKPRMVMQQQFEYAYIFSNVCPITQATEALINRSTDMDLMGEHFNKYHNELNQVIMP